MVSWTKIRKMEDPSNCERITFYIQKYYVNLPSPIIWILVDSLTRDLLIYYNCNNTSVCYFTIKGNVIAHND